MKVGDLIRDKEYPEDMGIIVNKVKGVADVYRVLATNGNLEFHDKSYIEKDCEVISESR